MTVSKFALAIVAAAAFATPAAAQVEIRKSDFDLSSRADVERLNNSIEDAARTVCRTTGLRRLADVMAERECVRDAITRAAESVPQVLQLRAEDARKGQTTGSLIASK